MKKKPKKAKKRKSVPQSRNRPERAIDATTESFVVGVGASAGGLDAIEKFFRNMPGDTGLTFVVVQHLSPDHRSFMVELLSKMTTMRVQHARDGMVLKPNEIYLIPPRTHLKLLRGKLLLTEPTHPRGLNLPIDIFFRSLAEDKGSKAVGVVLSGTGSDGSTGVRTIKEMGGTVMVQSLSSAQFDGMPKAAIATGCADFVCPSEEMPEHLLRYIHHPFVARGEFISREHGRAGEVMPKIFAHLREKCGVDFSDYRPTTIDRRIERRMVVNQMTSLEDYYKYLCRSPKESEVLFHDFLISVTRFFRDREAFECIEKEVLPRLFDECSRENCLRIWVPACATGEEAYSYAILLAEERERRGASCDIKIFATDISKEVLDVAALGCYPEGIAAQIPSRLLEKYFVPTDHGYQVNAAIRKMVVFALHDLTKNPPFTKLDFVSCRNALIYFQPTLQRKVLHAINFGLKPKGILFLGTSETVGELNDRFEALNVKHKVYQSRAASLPNNVTFTPRAPILTAHTVPVSMPAPVVPPTASNADFVSLEGVYRAILSDYAPGCLVLDKNHDVVHVLGDVGRFLKIKSGSFTKSVLKLTQPTLSAALASALRKSRDSGRPFVYEDVVLKQGKTLDKLRIRVKRLVPTKRTPEYVLVFIEEKGSAKASEDAVESFVLKNAANERIKQLQDELAFSKESLQSTLEELETTNEELQSSNEELMSSNEELQSTNEELQSVNEELHTVNAENQRRIDELVQLTSDINNLMAISSVGIMMVDTELRIRRCSETMYAMAGLLPQDTGAPLETLGRSLKFPQLIELAERVMKTGERCDMELPLLDGKYFLLRLVASTSETAQIQGLVITIVDITQRRRDQSEIETYRADALESAAQLKKTRSGIDLSLLTSVLNAQANPVAAIDSALRLVAFNESYSELFEFMFGRKPHPKMDLRQIIDGQPDELRQSLMLLERAAKGKALKVEQRFETVDKKSKLYQMTYSPLKAPDGQSWGVLQEIEEQ